MNDTKATTGGGVPGKRPYNKRKRDEHKVEFTEALIDKLPTSKSHMDWWYDTKQPYLMARRLPGKPAEYLFRYTTPQRQANQALLNTKVPVFSRLGVMSLAGARKAAETLWVEMQAIEGRWRRSQGEIPHGHQLATEPLEHNKPAVENADYETLMNTLMEAYAQATEGKGKERHARGLHFEDQDMLQLLRRAGIGFGIGQACKKALEAQHRKMGEARIELLGAIVYLAGTVIYLDEVISKVGPDK